MRTTKPNTKPLSYHLTAEEHYFKSKNAKPMVTRRTTKADPYTSQNGLLDYVKSLPRYYLWLYLALALLVLKEFYMFSLLFSFL